MIAATLFNGAVELFLDDTGIDSLIGELQSLRGKTTHIHKMTFAWGGKELSKQVPRGNVVHHLIIYSNAKSRIRTLPASAIRESARSRGLTEGEIILAGASN